MLGIKEKAFTGLGFLLVNLAAKGFRSVPPFYALTATMIPYHIESNRVNYMLYFLNCCVCLLFFIQIVKWVDEQYRMQPYILTRTSRQRALLMGFFRISRELGLLLLFKMAADLLLSQIKAFSDLTILLSFSASTYVTMLFWALAVYVLRAAGVTSKAAFAGTFVLLAVCQYMALFAAPFVTLAAIASPAYAEHPLLWLAGKLLLIGGTVLVLYLFYKYHRKNDSIMQTEGE